MPPTPLFPNPIVSYFLHFAEEKRLCTERCMIDGMASLLSPPACAGITNPISKKHRIVWDHPRVCGNNRI